MITQLISRNVKKNIRTALEKFIVMPKIFLENYA